MKQSTKRLMSAVLGLAFLIAAFGVFLQFIRPAYKNLNRLRGELVSRAELARAEKEVIRRVEELIVTYESTADAQEALAAAFPRTPSVAEATGQLNGLLLMSALAPQSFHISVSGDAAAQAPVVRSPRRSATSSLAVSPVGTVTFRIRTAGTYEDVRRFLHDLENNTRIMDVQDLSIRPAALPTQNLYLLEFTVAAYYQVDE